MEIRRLRVSGFRGFDDLVLKPHGHVLLVGQPGAGRSDLVEALWRVLSPDSTRFPLTDDLDFFKRRLDRRVEIEVVLGGLGRNLEQAFLDRLELWEPATGQLVEEVTPDPSRADNSLEYVVRLCYRAVWEPEQQLARHWVDFPKYSDPETEEFRRVPRDLREMLPAVFLRAGSAPLSLGPRGDLRQLLDLREDNDLSDSLAQMMDGVSRLAESLVASKDLADILEHLIDPLRIPLNLGERRATDVVRFAPEGGSLSGVLRGLQPTVKLREELGFMPLRHHGSTLAGLLHLAPALAQSESARAVVVVDDFGEGIDPDIAQHLASILRSRASQLWLSTRVGTVGQCFRPEEVIRLAISHEGVRSAHTGQAPQTKSERIAARHLHVQLLPAVNSRAVLIVEGPHDRAALAAAASKLSLEDRIPLPAARRIALLDAGAAEGSGGLFAVARLADLARQLGFHVIALIDWDRDPESAKQSLERNLQVADVVVRWPQGYAIERAVLSGLDEATIITALKDVSGAFSLPLEFDPDSVTGDELLAHAKRFLKSSGGLHAPFVESLPVGRTPPLLRKCFETVRVAVEGSGLVQLEVG